MNKTPLTFIIFAVISFQIFLGMDTQPPSMDIPLFPAYAFQTMQQPRTEEPLGEIYDLSSATYQKILPSGEIIDKGDCPDDFEFNKYPINPCRMNISTKDLSYAIMDPRSNVIICLKNLGFTSQQLNTIMSKKDNERFIMWDSQNNQRFDILQRDAIHKSLEMQYQEDRRCKYNDFCKMQNLLTEVGQSQKINNKPCTECENSKGECKALGEKNKQLAEELEKLKQRDREEKKTTENERSHYQKIARDNIFLKTVIGLALLGILCNYYGLASKIISSFATSTQ